ncbi:hypothetical protein Tco_1142104, partial [Tanacetum coccineum]
EGFLTPILLLVVIIVMVVIVAVILVIVVVVVIVGVVIVVAVIGVIVDTMKIFEFKTSRDRYGDNRMSDPIGGLEFLGSSGTGSLPSGHVDLTGDEDPTDEDGDTGIVITLEMETQQLVKQYELKVEE